MRIGKYAVPNQATVGEYANKWFSTFKSSRNLNTVAMYKNVINAHIKPAIGNILIKHLTVTDYQRMVNERFDHYETCNKIALTMKQIQRAAQRDKIIVDDFSDGIEMPKKTLSKNGL